MRTEGPTIYNIVGSGSTECILLPAQYLVVDVRVQNQPNDPADEELNLVAGVPWRVLGFGTQTYNPNWFSAVSRPAISTGSISKSEQQIKMPVSSTRASREYRAN